MDELNAEKMRLLDRISQVLTPIINGMVHSSLEERQAAEKEREASSKRIGEIENEVAMLTTQELKIAEIEESSLPFDFDDLTQVPGINEMVKKMLKEQQIRNFADFNEEYAKVNAEADAKIAGYEERESQLQRQNTELQESINQLQSSIVDLEHSFEVNLQENERLRTESLSGELRMKEVEQNRKNAVAQLEEARTENERLESHLEDLRKQLLLGERQAQRVIDVSPSLNEMYEQVKEAAEKRKMMITANLGLYTEIADEDGIKQVVRNNELEGLEIVDSFQLPELQSLDAEEPRGTESDVDGESMALPPSEDVSESDPPEAQESGKTLEERVADLELAIFGEVKAA